MYLPAQGDAEAVLERAMSPPHFPDHPRRSARGMELREPRARRARHRGVRRHGVSTSHKGGRTFGYRVSDGAASVAYLSDHCPTLVGPGAGGLGEYHDAAYSLAKGCDVLIHDAQLLDQEVPACPAFGHAAVGYAVGLARPRGVGRVVLFHHDPPRDSTPRSTPSSGPDADAALPVAAAAQGMVIDVPARPVP